MAMTSILLPFDTGTADIGVSHSGLAVRSVDRDIRLQVQSGQGESNVKMRTIRSGKRRFFLADVLLSLLFICTSHC